MLRYKRTIKMLIHLFHLNSFRKCDPIFNSVLVSLPYSFYSLHLYTRKPSSLLESQLRINYTKKISTFKKKFHTFPFSSFEQAAYVESFSREYFQLTFFRVVISSSFINCVVTRRTFPVWRKFTEINERK